ncbi:MAG: hypothetical protein ACOY0T_36970 [Myxococcota bacterium]
MNEPRRLREVSGSPVEHALLSAGASYRSSAEAHAKTIAALGLASSAALSAGVATAGASSLMSKLGWTKLISILSVGVAVVAPASYLVFRDKAPESVGVASVTNIASQPAAQTPSVSAAVPSATELAPATDVEASKSAPVLVGRATKSDTTTKVDSVAAELAVIDGVRSALARGDAAGALTRLDGYARVYPRGRLALEAEVLRIDALARSGQSALAARRAQAFLRRHPNSVLASRVRGYVNR